MKRIFKTIVAGLVALAISVAYPRTALADEPSGGPSKPSPVPPGLAMLVENVIDTVLEHHIDPPARQQMILTGIKALYKAAGVPVPVGLSRRVSMVTTPEQLASFARRRLAGFNQQIGDGRGARGSVAQRVAEQRLRRARIWCRRKNAKFRSRARATATSAFTSLLGMDEQEKRPKIGKVIEGGPADRAGVKSDDLIEQIEGVDTKGMALRDAVDRLRGDEGTNVTIKVRQAGAVASRTYTIVRGQHPRPTITGLAQASRRRLGLPDE